MPPDLNNLLSDSFREISPSETAGSSPADHVQVGVPIPKARRVELFAPHEWEAFTEEWASSLVEEYALVRRFGGAGDMGLDVAAFVEGNLFEGEWDNFQCKHYDHPLYPGDVWVEIGKIIYYTHLGEYSVPRRHFFVGSKGIGTTLSRLLLKPANLKAACKEKWSEHCENKITGTNAIKLEGSLSDYFERFDFGVFGSKSVVELITAHATTPFHSVRFGGGLPVRPGPASPPMKPSQEESRYIEQLFQVYSDHAGLSITTTSTLSAHADLEQDFLRQRVRFYHAESLRNFARDTVPPGTFEDLQEQVYQGVVDHLESIEGKGLLRMRSTLSQAATVAISSSSLASVTKTQDKQGICHQLANDDRLIWILDQKGGNA